MSLPEHVKESISSVHGDLMEDLRLWGKTKEEISEDIEESCLNGLMYIVHQDNISLVFIDKTPYTIGMYILPGEGYKPSKLTRILMETITMFRVKTDVHKLEIQTTCPDIWKILDKAGFQTEGILIDSRRLSDGFYVDEYSMGYLMDV